VTRYEIRVRENNVHDWAGWFDELQVLTGTGEKCPSSGTLLTGWLPDQAALLGILMRLHNLNLTIVSVYRLEK